ncbi:HotDog domain-containing protein [Pilobolus umbonatus]|nr:HotDog domain-containing protein [Pilobolus umbonatus]
MRIKESVLLKYPDLGKYLELYSHNTTCWETYLDDMTAIEASENQMVWEFKVEPHHCNITNNMHGGCVATLIDMCSSFTLVTAADRRWKYVGVSTDLSINYLQGVSVDEVIRIVCDVHREGKMLAYIYTKIYNKKGELCYTGSHTKFNIDSKVKL